VSTGENEGERTVILVRDSGRVLNRAPQFVGRPEPSRVRPSRTGCGRFAHWQADVSRVRPSRTSGFLPARFCGRSRADLLLERQSAALLSSCARPICQALKPSSVKGLKLKSRFGVLFLASPCAPFSTTSVTVGRGIEHRASSVRWLQRQ
jgi:hypothetical protein